ncbi:protein FAR1-RELATED SEQUENCE 7-like [Asparagus officinalis]|uniref:protein FAR1-RELATED SEQUENCE 7-like n=1 Tax=Asparagus officinalis TaxID=4686 RepID=UPI00098E52CF|nr:protein FAR1-RELATED SEQUENCE 7-like [Asparagus officinalis]
MNDPGFYFAIEVDSSGQMRSVFWVDGRSRASYLQFNDVVVFDVTYRTNKFSLSFAPFTSVNHHRKFTLLGCALLADDQEDTFVWLFQEWMKCMHVVELGAIIANQDRTMYNAIHSVFSITRHRYCYWHMQKHIINHLPILGSHYGEQFQRAKFNNALELVFDSEEKMQKLDDVLTNFIESIEEEVRETQVQMVDIPQIAASISHTMERIPHITVYDPDRPARTKGRPRNATRIQSGLDDRPARTKGRPRNATRIQSGLEQA